MSKFGNESLMQQADSDNRTPVTGLVAQTLESQTLPNWLSLFHFFYTSFVLFCSITYIASSKTSAIRN